MNPIDKLQELKQAIKILKAEAEELRTVILTDMKVKDLDEMTSDSFLAKICIQRKKMFDRNKAIEFISRTEDIDSYYEEQETEMLKIEKIKEAQ